MGNRAIITTRGKAMQVYLHWNGGKASIKAFLDYCNAKGYRYPENDCYGWARLCQVIGNFFGSTDSVGIGPYTGGTEAEDDNGTYIIEQWKIIGRENAPSEEEYDKEKYIGVLREINDRMPEKERLSDARMEELVAYELMGWSP